MDKDWHIIIKVSEEEKEIILHDYVRSKRKSQSEYFKEVILTHASLEQIKPDDN